MSFVTEILKNAAGTIEQRAAERDLPQERSMAATVIAFNALFGHNLTEAQGWTFMQLLKIKRSSTGPYREDHYIDGAAYTALAAEARASEWANGQVNLNDLELSTDQDKTVN